MPDLTVEYYYICGNYAAWWRRNEPAIMLDIKSAIEPEPECHWNEFTDGGEPIVDENGDKRCPLCKGPAEVYGMGV